MKENKDERITNISKARNLEEITDYWDTPSLADHWDETREVNFEVRMQRKCRVTLTPDDLCKNRKASTGTGNLTGNFG